MVLVGSAVLHAPAVRDGFDYRSSDAATFLLLGKALANGQGYVETFTPGAPPHTQYPPLFPLALAVVRLLGGEDAASHALVVFLGVLGLFLSWRLVRPWLGDCWACAVVAAVAATPAFLYFTARILSDVPFFTVACAALLAIRDAARPEAGRGRVALAAVATAAAILVRTVGIALVPAGLLALWCSLTPDRRGRAVVFAILVLLPVGAWALRNSASGTRMGTTYAGQFFLEDPSNYDKGTVDAARFTARAIRNTRDYAQLTTLLVCFDFPARARARWGGLPRAVDAGAHLLVVLVVGWGAWRAWRRWHEPSAPFLLFYAAILVTWPWFYDRFLVPAFALLLAFFLLALVESASMLGCKRRSFMVAGALLLLCWFVPRVSRVRWAIREYMLDTPSVVEQRDAFRELDGWLRSHAGPYDVILSRQASVVGLSTGHPCVVYERSNRPQALQQTLERWQVRWILVGDDLTRDLLGGTLSASPERYPVVFSHGPLVLHAVR